jgi:hypothetical protein
MSTVNSTSLSSATALVALATTPTTPSSSVAAGFQYVDINTVPHYLKCITCKFPAFEARYHASCFSLACGTCDTKHECRQLDDPWCAVHPVILDKLKDIKVYCTNHQLGCKFQLSRLLLPIHLKTCEYNNADVCKLCKS